ncbi:MAG TPA: hypothetical protein VFC61_06330 [Blastocatellia bacterium]|nr:hypothetical protein [Blastocatellia bacterium]
MRRARRTNLLTLGLLQRGLACFLLVFTFADVTIIDLVSPELCGEAAAGWPADADGTRPESPAPDVTDEDCFCCCSHVIPAAHVEIASFNQQPTAGAPRHFGLPSSPPRDTFHPPRLS